MSFQGDPRKVETWNRVASLYPMSLISPPYYHGKDLQYVTERFLPDKDTLAGKKMVDMGCGTGELAWKVWEKGNYETQVVGVDRSPEMVIIASVENIEPDANINVLELKIKGYEQDMASYSKAPPEDQKPDEQRAFEEKIERWKELILEQKSKIRLWENLKAARIKAIREGKQRPKFFRGDIEHNDCMDDILKHFSGPKVDFIFSTWVINILIPPKTPAQSDSSHSNHYTKETAKILRKWSSLLAPDGKIVIEYAHSSNMKSVIYPGGTPPKYSMPFRCCSPEDISDCKAELQTIAGHLKGELELDMDSLELPKSELQNRYHELHSRLSQEEKDNDMRGNLEMLAAKEVTNYRGNAVYFWGELALYAAFKKLS